MLTFCLPLTNNSENCLQNSGKSPGGIYPCNRRS